MLIVTFILYDHLHTLLIVLMLVGTAPLNEQMHSMGKFVLWKKGKVYVC